MLRKAPRTLNFTKESLGKLATPELGREYHYDERLPGLAICVTPRGTKTFYVVRRIGRNVERVRIGVWPQLTIEQARTEAAKINGTVANGINPNEARRASRAAPTLQEAFEEFLIAPTRTKVKRPRSAKTIKNYRQQFTYLAPWTGHRIAKISKADVESIHNDIGAKNGFVTANRVVTLLKAIYNSAIERGYAGPNPAAKFRRFEEQTRERFLQSDELPRFWKALENAQSDIIRDFVKLALFTGQRRSNVQAMRWEDINLDSGVWSIPITKSGRPHVVPLSTPALELLKRRFADRNGSEYVLPSQHASGHLKDPWNAYRAILAEAGIQNLTIHDLRRSLGSWQTITGTNEKTVGRTLGHSAPAATAIYSRVDLTAVRTSMETAGAAIMAAAKPVQKTKKPRKRKQS